MAIAHFSAGGPADDNRAYIDDAQVQRTAGIAYATSGSSTDAHKLKWTLASGNVSELIFGNLRRCTDDCGSDDACIIHQDHKSSQAAQTPQYAYASKLFPQANTFIGARGSNVCDSISGFRRAKVMRFKVSPSQGVLFKNSIRQIKTSLILQAQRCAIPPHCSA